MNNFFCSPYKYIFLSGLFVFLVTSFFSVGYYHPDEHFQILEFSNYKLGNTAAADLPWEFHNKIRPALLPAFGYIIIRIINTLNVYDPFIYALILRIISALLSWFVLTGICTAVLKEFSSPESKKLFLFLSFFLWFIPFISVRFSSENYSAITFLGAVYFILKVTNNEGTKKKSELIWAGLLLGLSFFFRFQIAFAILGLLIWLLFIYKFDLKHFLLIIFASFVAIAFCIYVDFWFYESFVLTPYNYFVSNIIENKAADWGTTPWWNYFSLFLQHAIPPLSIVLLLLFITGLYKNKKDVFSWCILLFLLGHFVVGHKEIRFLFPVAFCFIYLTAKGIDYFIINRKFQKISRSVYLLSAVINIPLLLVIMIIPARQPMKYFNFLYHYAQKNETILLCKEKSIYSMVGLNTNFYKPASVKCIVLNSDQEVSHYLKEYQPDSILILERTFSTVLKYDGYSNKTIYCALPKWITYINYNDWLSGVGIWKIQKLKKNNIR